MQSLLELIFKASKQGQGGKQAAAELKGIKDVVSEVSGGLGIMNLGAVSALGAVAAVGSFVKGSVDDWSKYAEEMGKAAELSGITAEEMSRITQAADDMRVPQETLLAAFEKARKNGFEPTIDNLADLADRIQGIQDPIQRTNELVKIFGKSGEKLYPILKDGGQAFRDNTAAIADNMIVTDEAVQQNREYLASVDTLNDSWTGFTNNIGRTVVPVLNDLLTAVNDNAAAAAEADKIVGMSRAERIKYIETEKERIQAERDMKDALEWGKTAQEQFNAQMDVGAGYAATLETKLGETAGTLNDELVPSLDLVKTSFGELTANMIFNKAAADLSAEGALALGRQLGLVNETTLYAMESVDNLTQQFKDGQITEEEYITRLRLIRDTTAGIESKDVTINVDTYFKNHYDESGKNTNNQQTDYQDYINRANGTDWVTVPPGYPNDSFTVGLSSGETYKVVNDRMKASGQGEGGGVIINFLGDIKVNSESDFRTFAARLKPEVLKWIK